MKPRFLQLYMDIAERVAQMSYAVRLKVGAVVVLDDRILSMGYNGTPSGWDNTCERRIDSSEVDRDSSTVTVIPNMLVTKPEVLHAEANALMKLARSTESGYGATLFCTHAPCMECAKMIYQVGIESVYFGKRYRDDSGLEFLRKSGVDVSEFTS